MIWVSRISAAIVGVTLVVFGGAKFFAGIGSPLEALAATSELILGGALLARPAQRLLVGTAAYLAAVFVVGELIYGDSVCACAGELGFLDSSSRRFLLAALISVTLLSLLYHPSSATV